MSLNLSRPLVALGLGCVLVTVGCQGNPQVSPRGHETSPTRPGNNNPGNGGGNGNNSGSSSPIGGLPDADRNAPVDAGASMPTASLDANCGLKDFKLERRPAEMLLILDRSGSMREPPVFGGLVSKWKETTPALHETVMKTASTVQWGLKLFPGDFITCNVADGLEVAPAIDNYARIAAAIEATTPTGTGTPTRYVMQKAVAYFQATASINARYIVLATDGEPNCADGMTNDLVDQDGAVEAVRMAAMAGYKTYVVGIATTMGDAHDTLNRMADAGGAARTGTAATDARYFPVASRQDLISTLGTITGQVSDCVFPLDKAPPSPNDVAVNVNGARVAQDSGKMNGWSYGAANKTVEIYGPACDAIKKGGADVKIIYGCPGVEIP